jgi:hypothetical protein
MAEMIEELKNKLAHWNPDPSAIWELRSSAQALGAYLETRAQIKNKGLAKSACEDIVAIGKDLYDYANEIRQHVSAKGYTQIATLFDLVAIGGLAIQDLTNGKWMNWKNVLTSATSEGSVLLASVQYIKAAEANLVATVKNHTLIVSDHLWATTVRLKKGMSPVEIVETRRGLDKFFAQISSQAMPLELRVALLFQLYTILLKSRLKGLIQVLEVQELPLRDLTSSGEHKPSGLDLDK